MYNNNNIPQNNGNMQSYRPNNRPSHGNNNDRFLGGGFFGPFILGGLTGGLIANSKPNYYPYYPYPYYQPYPYYPYRYY